MMVLIAICLPICVIMAAFAVNVAYMQLVRTELRTSTDAAARAAAKELSLSQSTSVARSRAKEVAERNPVGGDPLLLADSDIIFGKSNQANTAVRYRFTPGESMPNSVRITGKRTAGSASGPVELLFANVFGVHQFQPTESAISTQLDRDICVVVDRSGSMMWRFDRDSLPPGAPNCGPPDPIRSRWGSLHIAVKAFLVELENTAQDEHVGLVSYSSNTTECGNTYRIADINSNLVSDYTVIRSTMAALSGKPVKGNTSISAGIDKGITVLTGPLIRPYAEKTMVVMTDGIHNLGKEPIISARDAHAKGIVIHTITFGNNADITRMKKVAVETGGRHYHAPTEEELVEIFKEIASTLPVLLTD